MDEMEFSIGFDRRDLPKLHNYWDKIIETQKWTEGYFTEAFEQKWAEWNELGSVAFNGWTGGSLSVMSYYKLKGKIVLCPSNTFMATPLAIINSGAKVKFVDCNKFDLCMNYEDMVIKAEKYKPEAIWVVHIGGHISFDIERIAKYCKEHKIILLEDCAHAHGACWNGKKPGQWGDAGVYSFYATKTISTGEGGILVSKHKELIDYARQYRNYGKFDYHVKGLNYRMNEFTAAIGLVSTERMKEIIEYKNEYAQKLDQIFMDRIILPEGMISGYYKYIVFEKPEKSTGKVYDEPCHKILKHKILLPNTEWVAKNHWCVPIYYNTKSVC